MPFNEMFEADGKVRAPYAKVEAWLKQLGPQDIARALRECEARFRKQGITVPFTVTTKPQSASSHLT